MNSPELIQLAQSVELDRDDNLLLRVKFGVSCIERVEHLLTNSMVLEVLSVGKAFASGDCDKNDLMLAAKKASYRRVMVWLPLWLAKHLWRPAMQHMQAFIPMRVMQL